MIRPTIGRVVWFRPSGLLEDSQPLTALICYVHSDSMVNIAVFDDLGIASNKCHCYLYQGEGVKPTGDYCEWVPYQVGQAKAHNSAV